MNRKEELPCEGQNKESAEAALQVRPGPIYKPRYTSSYDAESWEVRIDLPGVKKEHLAVTVENEILEVKATRLLDIPESWRPLAEYPSQKSYRLRLDVGPEVDSARISADLENGVLALRLPLREELKPRSIEVK
jgi:HSP20 family molecular chaperone IbpA